MRKRALPRAACETDDERRLWTTAQSRAGDFGWLWSISHPFPHAKSPSPSRPPRDLPSDRRIATKNGAMIPCRPSRCSSAKAKATDRPPACSAELWRAFGLEGRPMRRTRARRTLGAENPGPKDARCGARGRGGCSRAKSRSADGDRRSGQRTVGPPSARGGAASMGFDADEGRAARSFAYFPLIN